MCICMLQKPSRIVAFSFCYDYSEANELDVQLVPVRREKAPERDRKASLTSALGTALGRVLLHSSWGLVLQTFCFLLGTDLEVF